MAKKVTYSFVYQTEDGIARVMDEFEGQVDLKDPTLSFHEGLRVVERLRYQADLMENIVRSVYEDRTKED
jgi:hypothetical protein